MILAILQARISSKRLPGKVLKPILGEPMLKRQIERVKYTSFIDKIVVATSTDKSDEPIEEMCHYTDVECYRGNLGDVLDRFYQTAKKFQPEHVVRLTGDCPLFDPEIAEKVIKFHLDNNFDYTSNTLEPTFPDGLDIEIFKFSVLEKAWKEAELASQREHVTPYIYQNPQIFKLGSFKNNTDLSKLRWTVDEQLDYELICKIYENLYPFNPRFVTKDILNFVNSNSLDSYNTMYSRNEGYTKSLKNDQFYDRKKE